MKFLAPLVALLGIVALGFQKPTTAGTATYVFNEDVSYTLHFNAHTSVFYAHRTDSPEISYRSSSFEDPKDVVNIIEADQEGHTVYKSLKDSVMIERHLKKEYYPDNLLLREVLPSISWEMTDEKRNILGHDCQLASGMYKQRRFYAWFAPSIPVANGPWKLGGLPGLILDVYDEQELFSFRCTAIEFSEKNIALITPPSNGQAVSWEEYVSIHQNAEATLNARNEAFDKAFIEKMKKIDPNITINMGGFTLHPRFDTAHIEGKYFLK